MPVVDIDDTETNEDIDQVSAAEDLNNGEMNIDNKDVAHEDINNAVPEGSEENTDPSSIGDSLKASRIITVEGRRKIGASRETDEDDSSSKRSRNDLPPTFNAVHPISKAKKK